MLKMSFSQSIRSLSNRLFLLLIIGITLSFTLLPVQVYAEDYYQNNSLNAGIYLRIPFGAVKKNENSVKFGLRLNMTREFTNSPWWNSNDQWQGRQNFNADLMSLNFSEKGFRHISFAGRKAFVLEKGILRAATEEDIEGGTSTIVWVLATVGVVVLAGMAAFAIALNDDCAFNSRQCN